MNRPFYSSEILQTQSRPEGETETVATIDAHFDADSHRLHAHLDCFLRRVNVAGKDLEFREPWLPSAQNASEGVDPEEAGELAHDLFHRWVAKVRNAIAARAESSGSV